MDTESDIYFAEEDVLGNLYPCEITLSGKEIAGFSEDKFASLSQPIISETFSSVEHLYQAFKYLSSNDIFQNRYAKIIQTAKSPLLARYLGEGEFNTLDDGELSLKLDVDIDDSLTKHMNDFREKISPILEWDEKREEVMLLCLLAKFSQNPECAKALLDTKTASLHLTSNFPINATMQEKKEIVKSYGKEHEYWSTAISSLGRDRLGALLMQVREQLPYIM